MLRTVFYSALMMASLDFAQAASRTVSCFGSSAQEAYQFNFKIKDGNKLEGVEHFRLSAAGMKTCEVYSDEDSAPEFRIFKKLISVEFASSCNHGLYTAEFPRAAVTDQGNGARAYRGELLIDQTDGDDVISSSSTLNCSVKDLK